MDSNQSSDQLTSLAVAARDGDGAALEAFIRASQSDVWRLCSYLASPDEADDLAQETFERAIGSLHRFHGRSGARPWLFTICRRVCVDSTRRSIRRRRIDDAAISRAHTSNRTTELDSSIEIDTAIGKLPEERRAAFLLTQVVGLSYAEAAAVLDVAIGTIRSRVARARLMLIEDIAVQEAPAPTRRARRGSA